MSVPNNRNPVEQALWGMARTMVGFPIEYPFINLKARAQGTPNLSVSKTLRQLRTPLDLYTGGAATFARRITREMIRWPVVSVCDQYIQRLKFRHRLYEQLLMGTYIATLDTFLFLPFDRLTLTQINEQGYLTFYRRFFRTEGVRALYHGCGPAFARNVITWATLIPLHSWATQQARLIDPKRRFPVTTTAAVTAGTAGVMTLITMPVDFICTRMQLDPQLQNKRYYQVTRALFRSHGFKGFFTGTSFTFVSMSLFVMFTGQLLEKITPRR